MSAPVEELDVKSRDRDSSTPMTWSNSSTPYGEDATLRILGTPVRLGEESEAQERQLRGT